MARVFTAAEVESFQTAFDTFSEENAGVRSVSTESLAEILEIMEKPYDEASVQTYMAELDVNNSGRLEFDEFVKLIAKFL
ncbi:troponin C, isoallergen Bla g 6.0301-like [Bradysia coprophila]|uniref:troponin C, isoallergen Bla g 6.0301-like n=1 Tax=Bradysia coprophila TaxID=38358 RepID=UPI00187DB7A3|nr:troponin C, isoallergen Bla g 6.0301-like [Bradysia coprophila]